MNQRNKNLVNEGSTRRHTSSIASQPYRKIALINIVLVGRVLTRLAAKLLSRQNEHNVVSVVIDCIKVFTGCSKELRCNQASSVRYNWTGAIIAARSLPSAVTLLIPKGWKWNCGGCQMINMPPPHTTSPAVGGWKNDVWACVFERGGEKKRRRCWTEWSWEDDWTDFDLLVNVKGWCGLVK